MNLRNRTAVISAVAVVVVVVLVFLFSRAIEKGAVETQAVGAEPAAFRTADKCVTCHKRSTPAIAGQWAVSTHARRGITCRDCHVVTRGHPTAQLHEGEIISSVVTPKVCSRCHPREAQQFAHSRHGLPAWVALVGEQALAPAQLAEYRDVAELRPGPTGIVGAMRNALHAIEGPEVTPLACDRCHSIGRPNADGSNGNCNKCHFRHEFSRVQVRKPETCNNCHIGPDHPQWEIYEESAHGILYHTQGDRWNWLQEPGRLTVQDFPAPTCQVCHMSGFGAAGTTHDVGDRLSWFLFAETSDKRPSAIENRDRMKQVCRECHAPKYIDDEYKRADAVVTAVNRRTQEAKQIMTSLVRDGVLTTADFDHPIKFTAFDLWHYYGRTAKFGAFMQGADYTQWHGMYPLLSELAKLKQQASELRREHAATGRPAVTPVLPGSVTLPTGALPGGGR